ncbi:MAG: amidase [Deltaproteobacteria bacterium]|nr:MAG: amidase [Deltaproteobacteria bacterium]
MELWNLSGLEMAQMLRSGDVSSLQLTEALLDRISKKDIEINSFTQVLKLRALKDAKKKDKVLKHAIKKGELDRLPLFYGVPTGLKDLTPLRGSFTRLGSRGFRYFISPYDNWVTKRLKEAGFVFLGKLATSEFGAMPVTETDIHPPSRNPCNQNYPSGGSSGGSAAAVAAKFLPFAQGSDGAGSIRIPSALCGCFGFKPSRDMELNPSPHVDKFGLATIGPITRDIEDAAAFLDAMNGMPLEKDSLFRKNLNKDFQKLNIKVCYDNPIVETDPVIRNGIEGVVEKLKNIGHHVEEIEAIDARLEEFLPIWQKLLANVPNLNERVLQPVTKWLRVAGKPQNEKQIKDLTKAMEEKVFAWIGDADFVLTPTVPVFPPKIGEWRELPPEEAFSKASHLGVFTAPFNISGQPAASLPLGRNELGLPFALQIAGRRSGDVDVLAFSKYLQDRIIGEKFSGC